MCDFNISSTSIDENTGSARIEIDGQLTIPNECDDPIVELFRPVRAKYRDKIFFIVTVKHKDDGIIVCNIFPSNTRNRPLSEFLATALNVLEGDETGKGMLLDYIKILEAFFVDKDGLDAYIERIKKAETANEDEKLALHVSCNALIKEFVAKVGLTMPSRKKPPRKTREERHAAYLAKQAKQTKNAKQATSAKKTD